jgi:hypothetical protein
VQSLSELWERLVGNLSAKRTHTRLYAMTMNRNCHSNNNQRDDIDLAFI